MAKKAVLTEYQLAVSGIKQPLRVALIADVHERKNDDVLALLRQAKPDIIAVAGDTLERFDRETGRPYRKNAYSPLHRAFLMVAFQFNYLFIRLFGRKNLPDTQNAYALLQGAARLAPVFVSLGNHEEKLLEEDVAFLNENGITLLDNADVKTVVCGEHVRIGGLSTAADEDGCAVLTKRTDSKFCCATIPNITTAWLPIRPLTWCSRGITTADKFVCLKNRCFPQAAAFCRSTATACFTSGWLFRQAAPTRRQCRASTIRVSW